MLCYAWLDIGLVASCFVPEFGCAVGVASFHWGIRLSSFEAVRAQLAQLARCQITGKETLESQHERTSPTRVPTAMATLGAQSGGNQLPCLHANAPETTCDTVAIPLSLYLSLPLSFRLPVDATDLDQLHGMLDVLPHTGMSITSSYCEKFATCHLIILLFLAASAVRISVWLLRLCAGVCVGQRSFCILLRCGAWCLEVEKLRRPPGSTWSCHALTYSIGAVSTAPERDNQEVKHCSIVVRHGPALSRSASNDESAVMSHGRTVCSSQVSLTVQAALCCSPHQP